MKTLFQNAFLSFLLVILLPVASLSQKTPKISARAKSIIKELMEDKIAPGVAIGVVSEDGIEIFCTGRTATSGGTEINENTIFQLGSATKAFTGILLADQILRKNLFLDDPVEKYLPPSVKLPSRNGKKIKFIDLATHSSALPVRPSDYKIMENGDYSVERLYSYLPSIALEWDIGSKWSYSSLGAALVGHVISRLENQPFSQVLRDKILRPLGMNSTDIVLTKDMKRRVSKGHDQRREAKWLNIPEVFAPSGAINTTVSDMVKFLSANLGITKFPLNDAMNVSHKSLRQFDDGIVQAMLWRLDSVQGHTFVGHSGDTFGFSSYVGIDKENKTGVVILSNGKMGVRHIGYHILSGGKYELTKKDLLLCYYEE